MGETLRYLSAADVAQCMDIAAAIRAMGDAFAQLSAGRAVSPLRVNLPVREAGGTALFMPSYLPDTGRVGLKIVTVFPGNRQKGLPPIDALVTVLSGATGRPLAVMDGEHLTALRTGAASGLATDLLARKDASTVMVFGAGVQARTQLEAVCAVRPIRQAWVYDPEIQRAEAFALVMTKKLGLAVTAAQSPSVVAQAHVVCTATPATAPVFDDADIAPGTHINGIGSYTPQMVEVPAQTVRRAWVVVDQREACLAEAGDLRQPLDAGLIGPEHIRAEIGEIAAGLKPGRPDDAAVTFFKSVGNAVQDLAVASLVLDEAEKRGLGVLLER